METVTIDQIIEFVAGAIILFQFVKWLISFADPFVALKKRVDKHDEFFANDQRRIEELDKKLDHLDDGLSVVGLALAELINHTITGNDIPELKKQQKEITNFFFKD